MNTWYMAQFNALGGADQSDLEGMAADIAGVYNAAKNYIVNSVTVRISPVVEGIDVATGNLVQVEGIDAPAAITGQGSSSMSRATQVCMQLRTDEIRGNRLLRGRHFIGPAGASVIGSDGQVTTAVRTAMVAAYGGVLDVAGNGRLVVYSKKGKDKDGRPFTGSFGYVQSVLANSVPGTLRSRKI